ncbi:hypothetical protein [Chryseobacterium indoltheticum]|uniref:hypothetical protein n=1 Tax=Chryseobacterium indoltheticum TaxID=254 RepID=UPI003F493FA5
MEKQIDELSQQIGLEQKTLIKKEKTLTVIIKALEKFRLDEAKKEEQIKTNQANLKLLSWLDYEKKPILETEEIYNTLSQSNRETEENYQKLNKEKKKFRQN